MVVVAIVGVLSATALPQFLDARTRAIAGSAVGSLTGMAKECATGKINGGSTLTADTLDNQGITLTGDCSTQTASATMKNKTAFTIDVVGQVCGRNASGAEVKAASGDKVCTLTIAGNGQVTGAWSAS